MAIDNGSYDAKRTAEIAAYPEVASSRTYMAPFGGLLRKDGRPDFSGQAENVWDGGIRHRCGS